MSTLERRSLERMRYRKGQSLRSRDFRDLLRNDAHLRWWHNRAIHRAYGVVEGFQLEGLVDYRLRVHPGKAYDAYGREIMLTRPVVIPVQTPVNDYALIVRYQEPETGCVGADASSCLPGYRPVEEAGVEFLWKPVDELSYRDGVLLTQWVGPAKGGLVVHPYNARPYARPRMAAGVTQPEMTAWEVWFGPYHLFTPEVSIGFQTVVDISQAGFISTPCIYAGLGGQAWEPMKTLMEKGGYPSMFIHVQDVTPTRFLFRLILHDYRLKIEQISEFDRLLTSLPSANGWHVNWLGIQGSDHRPQQRLKTKKRIHV